MGTDSFFALACAGLIGILFGLAVCFAGYRLFLFLLPIWGFFFGLVFGAQTMQALFGVGFLATITSWIVGFIVGAVFAVLAYLFYIVAVALIAGSLGYAVAVGLLTAIGLQMGFLVWLIGIVAAVALAIITLRFNLAKWVIIIATGILGAGIIVGSIVGMFFPASQFMENPVQMVFKASPLTAILAIVVAVLGILAQIKQSKYFKLEQYDRWNTGEPV
jgi:hypothetical protein